MKKIVKKILPVWFYAALKNNPVRRYKKVKAWDSKHGGYYRSAVNAGQRVFLLNTPEHTNLGDLAIAEAEIAYLKLIMPEEQIIEISALVKNIFGLDTMKKIIPKDALILFHGGGYIGTDWPAEEEIFRRAVKLFPNNRFVLLPQSVFYSADKKGEAALKRSVRDLSRHKDLHLFAREAISYELMKKYYKNAHIYLTPDIVLSMEYAAAEAMREGVLMCMRADREKLLTGGDTAYIEKACAGYGQVEYTDTVLAPGEYNGAINAETRGSLVNTKLERFSRAKLVVTDRLHGMVFAALTGTPCVALSNHNHKVKGTAEWIKNLGYIRYIENTEEFAQAAEAVLAHGPGRFDRNAYLPHFDRLEKVILRKS